MRNLAGLVIAGALALLGSVAAAQGMFSAVITVNDRAITGYEIDQRLRLLEAFRTPGDLPRLARTQLVEDRLKQAEMDRAGLRLTDEGLGRAMEEFASRANLTRDQFIGTLAQMGVAEETIRDYVAVNASWRDYVRARYGARVTVSDADIDFALERMGQSNSGVSVLLSEIIIPAPPPDAARVTALAEQISRYTSQGAFEAAARQYSALPSRDQGGRIDWMPLANLPEPLHPLLLGLAPGQVTPPIQIEGAVALFQMRAVREGAQVPQAIALVDYAVFHAASRAEAAQVAARIDTCDDLYGVAQGLPPERLERQEVAPAAIPQDVALELARLDRDEISTALSEPDGSGTRLVMLCHRTPVAAQGASRDDVANQIRGERLQGYADALVADLRASAVITGE
ncbi:MAG: peptidylprolyl isomerase [Rubellimicrobium sp.]|nr:peptidylprolyl isomerase [Rubellimicrobium sp.]